MRNMLKPLLLFLAFACVRASGGSTSDYNVVWTSNSNTSANSMPTGNGDIGLNVWTEDNGDLMLYIGKTDAMDETCRLLKLGRLRIHFSNNPFAVGQAFRQELDLSNSEIRITAGSGTDALNIRIWADANHPAVHVESQSATAFGQSVQLEPLRTTNRDLTGMEAHGVDGLTATAAPMQYPDVVADTGTMPGLEQQLVWYHRNGVSVYPATLQVQNLNPAQCPPDPLLGRTFGCAVAATGLVRQSSLLLATSAPVSASHVIVTPLTLQVTDANDWLTALSAQSAQLQQLDLETARTTHQAWWQAFWQRSWVRLSGGTGTDTANISLGWHLNRYLTACMARGNMPVKFNGGIFNVDGIDAYGNAAAGSIVDARQWGTAFWFQNERQIYWPMLEAGDYEQLLPFFKMYRDALAMATYRTQAYYQHDGAFFPETMYFWGAYLNRGDLGYGWDRTGKADGLTDNQYIRRYWQGGIELTAMMLEYYRHTGDSQFVTDTLLPLAENIMTFYDQHYPRDAQGKIHMDPAQMLETFWNVVNPTPEIAGLRCCLNGLLELPTGLTTITQRSQWTSVLGELPPLPTGTTGGVTVIASADLVRDGSHNIENGNLYALWPYKQIGVTPGNLKLARDSYNNRWHQGSPYGCWITDPLFAAHAGLSQGASDHLASRFVLSGPLRFPVFYAGNFDWVPDCDNGGVCQNTIQSMLMQCDGIKIVLLPAWPANWNADFKLCAPYQTTVEGTVTNGLLSNLKVTPASRLADVVITAGNPNPADQEVNVNPQVRLAWSPVLANCQYDLYFGTSAAAVANATTNSPEYLGRSTDTSYAVANTLLFNTTYYWRVDEVVPDSAIATGAVWSFTTMPPPIVWNGNVSGTWDLGTTANWLSNGVAVTYDNANIVRFDDTATGTTTVTNAVTVSPLGVVVDNSTKNYTIGGSPIAGSGGITKSGTGILNLTATNTYTGTTSVLGGTLNMSTFPVSGNGGSPVAGAAVNIAGGAVLTVNYASGVTKALSTLTGGGIFNLVGSGTFDPIYCGGTEQAFAMDSGALWHVVSGTARLGYGYAAHWLANRAGLTVDSGATLNLWDHVNDGNGIRFDALTGAGTITETEGQTNTFYLGVANGGGTFSGIITDTGGSNSISLVKTGTGNQILSGSNAFTGNTTVDAGTLTVTVPNTWKSATTTINAGAFLEMNTNSAINLQTNTHYTGTGVLRKSGAGMIGNANNPVTFNMAAGGVFDIQAGDWNLGGPLASESMRTNLGSMNVATGATFHISNTLVQVDALTGGGKINNAYNSSTPMLTLGVSDTTNNADFGITNHTAEFSGTIGYAESYNTVSVGTMRVVKSGAGTQVLSGANGYTGTTTVNGGNLVVNGSLAAGSAVTVNAGATLGGSGTVGGTVTAAGTIAPGSAGIGTLHTGAVVLTGSYACEISGAGADTLAVTGNLTITGAALKVSVLAPATAPSYVIATYTGTLTGTFTSSGLPAGYRPDYTTAGQIKLVSRYAAWINGFNLSGDAALMGADPDHDGIPNGIEFVLGGNPAAANDASLLPAGTRVTADLASGSREYFKFIYRLTQASVDASVVADCDYCADLPEGVWNCAVNGVNDVVIFNTSNGYGAGVNKVEVWLPLTLAPQGRMFVRLHAVLH